MELIEELEGKMLLADCDKAEYTTVHHFSPGLYVREATMQAGAVFIGHEHATTHLNIISKGSCILLDLTTGEKKELHAPCTFEAGPGTRKVVYILEECTWSNIHVTDETNLEKLEEQLIVKSDTYNKIIKELEWHS